MILYTNLNNIREKKKIIIPESKLALLSEALSDEVFHYTSLNTGLKIANTDTIYLQSALGGSADNTNRKELYLMAENFHKDSKEKQLTTGVHQWVK